MSYQYTGTNGDFKMEDPELTSYLYFPLANENSVKSCVAPDLGGDTKIGQNAFLMPPVSAENLHNDKSSRNIWCRIDDKELWSVTGRSSAQQTEIFQGKKEHTVLAAGLMHHTITRISDKLGLSAELKSLVPCTGQQVELLKVSIKNTGKTQKSLQVISAIPIYARSADNIRDHRHVTALLHRIRTTKTGVVVFPTMSFDERGHRENKNIYGVFGGNEQEHPIEFFPTVESFIQEGGSLENPGALLKNQQGVPAGSSENGYEALGGLCFPTHQVEPGETISYTFVLSYGTDAEKMEQAAKHFFDGKVFDKSWEETKKYWQEKVNIAYHTGDSRFDQWMRWVSFQPMLRRIYGCSFLPHHDYGRGGRGWRDLWQDALALIMMNPSGVKEMLVNNFGGVRTDGTNATIIGEGPGEFVADRNHITRVWMDHGVWPLLTTDLYIQQTGDIEILLDENTYFKDPHICRGEEEDTKWSQEEGEKQRDETEEIYQGSILEHLLIQHLTAFYDVGEHNHIRLRGADWNDALDLAPQRGESVAFTAMYAKNMKTLSGLLEELQKTGRKEVELMEELSPLLSCDSAMYGNTSEKQSVLAAYCSSCGHRISGRRIGIQITVLQKTLQVMSDWIFGHIRKTEWIALNENQGWYNGYYDNSGNQVEGVLNGQIRMMLTSQVFTLMSGAAEDDQIDRIVCAARHNLFEGSAGGFRLNTDFKEVKMDLGRMFGFAYGHKENGAVFSHMATMFGNALYQRNAAKEGADAIFSLFRHCDNFERSKIYPGVPEYIDAKGRGVYNYLTGAASWINLTVVTQMFGVRGRMGDLLFDPKLCGFQFDKNGEAGLQMEFAGRKLAVIYQNKQRLEPGAYEIKEISCNGVKQQTIKGCYEMKREFILNMPPQETLKIIVKLGEKQ